MGNCVPQGSSPVAGYTGPAAPKKILIGRLINFIAQKYSAFSLTPNF